MKSTFNRRNFIKISGTVLGGIATGTTVVAAERTDRFIVETNGNGDLGDVEVVHEMPGVDVAVVRGTEKELERAESVNDFGSDIELELDAPSVNEEAPNFDGIDTSGPLDFFQWDKDALDINEAHETTQGEGTRVSVIDTGVLETHPDLVGPLNVELSRNFTEDEGDHNPVGGLDHGTHVAGIIAADNGSQLGVNGTAPQTDLVDCRVFTGNTATFGDILAAIVYSTNIDADAANLSLGAYPVPRQGLGAFYGGVLNKTLTFANKEGTLLCIAAGNDSADLQHDRNFISLPAEGAQGLAVSATGPVGYGWNATDWGGEEPPESPAFYTNYGTNVVTVGAPGGNASIAVLNQLAENDDDDPDNDEPVPANWFNDLVFNAAFTYEDTDEDGEPDTQIPGYGWKAGTSMASPQVVGAAALIKSANPNYNVNQIEAAIMRAADVPDDFDKTYYGSGFLNVVDAL